MNNPFSPALSAHYSQALGLTDPWKVTAVSLDTKSKTLDIDVLYDGRQAPCPECATACTIHNLRERRSWRHLDMMQFTTTIHAQTPRTDCPLHGVKTIRVPWADAHSRFTLLFEAFAINVLQATASVKQAQSLLHLSWDAVQRIKERGVERGLARRDKDKTIRHLGTDEKNFLKGHNYATLATDLDEGSVLDVVKDRTLEAARELLNKAVPDHKRAEVKAGAMDMWEPFATAFRELFPNADIVHDKFHVSKYLGEAVDIVRRKEHRAFLKDGNDLLTGAKYLFLKNDLEDDEKKRFDALMHDELKVGRAWTLKEMFRHFWDYVSVAVARKFFNRWYFRATHCRLASIIKVAKMLKRHLDGLLAYCKHKISNAVTEGLNSKIQAIKANARGFRNFEHYRIAILFGCGKLSMLP